MATNVSLLDALLSRYDNREEEDDTPNFVQFVIPRKNQHFSDANTCSIPPILCLTHQSIRSLGDFRRLSATTQHVQELDLGDNKLSDWSDVLQIFACMPRLEFLNLSGNPLGHITDLRLPLQPRQPNSGSCLPSAQSDAMTDPSAPSPAQEVTTKTSTSSREENVVDEMSALSPKQNVTDDESSGPLLENKISEDPTHAVTDFSDSSAKQTTTDDDSVPPSTDQLPIPNLNPSSAGVSNLSRLVLNYMVDFDWNDLWKVLTLATSLRELHLCKNGFRCVSLPQGGEVFPQVKDLFLNHNRIEGSEDLEKLGEVFPQVQHLVVMSNPLQSLRSDQATQSERFVNVKRLNVSRTAVDSWDQLESLNHWPQLDELRIKQIKLSESYDEKSFRQWTICYLPRIRMLNGSPVLDSEREDAERAFVRHYATQEERPQRYNDLHARLGDLDPLAEVDLKPEKSVTVTVCFEGKSQLWQVGLDWTLRQVRQHLATMLSLPAKEIILYYRDIEGPYGDERMTFDTRTILRYGVKEGDQIHVDQKK